MTLKQPGFVNGTPLFLLRAEGLAVLILAPDLSMLGYLAGPRIGAAAYNAVHAYVGPVILLSVAVALAAPVGITIALIWIAHLGIDRALGFGLKYGAGFAFTHLGRVGPRAQSPAQAAP